MKTSCSRIAVIAVAVIALAFSATAFAKKDGNGTPPGQAKKQASEAYESHGHESDHGDEAHGHKEHHHDASATTAGTPPGWSHGKKTGWRGMPYPPGWSKWDKEKQERWETDRNRSLDEIHVIAVGYKIPTPEVDRITQAFGQAVAGGLVINDAQKKLVNALQDENERKKLLINTTQNTLELLK
jgi:hypothetical protein